MAVALVLAAVGIYGVMATVVGARRGEIGVRLALGSTPAQAVSLVWRRGALLVVAGLLLGSAAAWGATRLLVGLLHGVDPLDLPSFAAAAVALVVVGLGAAYLPARRAASVSPSTVLRQG